MSSLLNLDCFPNVGNNLAIIFSVNARKASESISSSTNN